MGRQIIKQPNGKYALWSTVVDDFLFYNASESDIVDFLVEEAKKTIESDVSKTIKEIENGKKPYYQFTMSYKDCLDRIKEVHGLNELVEVVELIENRFIL